MNASYICVQCGDTFEERALLQMHWDAEGHAPEATQQRVVSRARAGVGLEPAVCEHDWQSAFRHPDGEVAWRPAFAEESARCTRCGEERAGEAAPVANAVAQRRRQQFRLLRGGRS